MPKLTIPIIPLVAVLLLVAHTCCASKWQEHDSSCSKQLERVNLRHCERHIREKMERDDDERNYIRKQREGEHEEKCCDELSELNSARCQCRAMQKIMEMERQSQKLQGLEKLPDGERAHEFAYELWVRRITTIRVRLKPRGLRNVNVIA